MRQSDECGDYYYYYRDLRKLAMNLIPFPRLHYLLPSYGPLVAEGHAAYQGSTVNELVGSCVPLLPVVVSFQSTSTNTAVLSLPPLPSSSSASSTGTTFSSRATRATGGT